MADKAAEEEAEKAVDTTSFSRGTFFGMKSASGHDDEEEEPVNNKPLTGSVLLDRLRAISAKGAGAISEEEAEDADEEEDDEDEEDDEEGAVKKTRKLSRAPKRHSVISAREEVSQDMKKWDLGTVVDMEKVGKGWSSLRAMQKNTKPVQRDGEARGSAVAHRRANQDSLAAVPTSEGVSKKNRASRDNRRSGVTGIAPPAGSKLASRLKDPAVKSKLNALAAYLKQGAKLCTDARTRERALAMLVHLQDIVSTRWFSSEQVQMIASLYPPDTELKLPVNPRVEILLALHSRTIDLWNYDNVLKMLPADERAELTFRLGVLNVWTPLKPDGPIMLDLTQMEERQVCLLSNWHDPACTCAHILFLRLWFRQVAKMLVHIMRSEPGLSWKDETFQWDRFQHPIPGWDLNEAWYTESGMPAKGILALE